MRLLFPIPCSLLPWELTVNRSGMSYFSAEERVRSTDAWEDKPLSLGRLVVQQLHGRNGLIHPTKGERVDICHRSHQRTSKPFPEEKRAYHGGEGPERGEDLPELIVLVHVDVPVATATLLPAGQSLLRLHVQEVPERALLGGRATGTCGDEPRERVPPAPTSQGVLLKTGTSSRLSCTRWTAICPS